MLAVNRSQVRPPRQALAWLVVRCRLSDVALAELCGVAASSVRRWLAGYAITQPPREGPRIGKQALSHLYEDQRLPLAQVAAKLDLPVNTVRALLRRHHITPRPPGRIPGSPRPLDDQLPDDQTLAQLYAAGWAIKPLAAKYRVSPTTIHHRLKTAGVRFRPRGRPSPKPPAPPTTVAAQAGPTGREPATRQGRTRPAHQPTRLQTGGPHGPEQPT